MCCTITKSALLEFIYLMIDSEKNMFMSFCISHAVRTAYNLNNNSQEKQQNTNKVADIGLFNKAKISDVPMAKKNLYVV